MPNYRIVFSDGPNGDLCKVYDVEANDYDEAFDIAYGKPEARQRWKYSDVSVMEVRPGPKTIGIRFAYTQFGRPYSQYLFIRAETEEQAKQFYRKNLQGRRFWQPWPEKPNGDGNCVYGEIRETYFAAGDRFAFDATI